MSKFPEPVSYTREDGASWPIKEWDVANQLLGYLSLDGNAFIIFEKPDGSYVQCAGSKQSLTVEARIYSVAGNYKHYVFGKGLLRQDEQQIPTTDCVVTLDSTQVLQMRHARLIMRPWLEGVGFPGTFTMTDVTSRFGEASSPPST